MSNTKQTEIGKVRENLNLWLKYFNEKNVSKMMELYDAESVFSPAVAPMMQGTETLSQFFGGMFQQVNGTMLYKEEFASAGESMAILVGKYCIAPLDQNADLTSAPAGRVALIYRKDNAGDWKLLFDMDNTPPDVTGADFA